jgi:hypothetical protein
VEGKDVKCKRIPLALLFIMVALYKMVQDFWPGIIVPYAK